MDTPACMTKLNLHHPQALSLEIWSYLSKEFQGYSAQNMAEEKIWATGGHVSCIMGGVWPLSPGPFDKRKGYRVETKDKDLLS